MGNFYIDVFGEVILRYPSHPWVLWGLLGTIGCFWVSRKDVGGSVGDGVRRRVVTELFVFGEVILKYPWHPWVL